MTTVAMMCEPSG